MIADHSGACFLDARRGEPRQGSVALVGVPYDGSTSFRPGARFGPAALRGVSDGLESYSPRLDLDLNDMDLVDLGDLDVSPGGAPEPIVAAVHEAAAHLLGVGARPLFLGGDHSFTPGIVRAFHERYPDLAVIQIDAHADLRPAYYSGPFSHACSMRRCLDFLAVDALLQVGIRSGTREEFQELRASRRLVPPTAAALLEAVRPFADRPVYLTLDLDAFDPSIFPGTGTPEPGGLSWDIFSDMLDVLRTLQLVGADVVELAPNLDSSGVSSILAAKAVRELILLLGE